jgi:DNA polymerase alpha subunit A
MTRQLSVSILTLTGKRKREEDREKKDKIESGISKYFNAGSVAAQPKPKV